jgi:DNA repair protein RecO (recombination protein O)
MRPVLQPGNVVRATWRARLDEHLGHYVVEGLQLRAAALFQTAHALYGVTHLAALCRLLPERDPHPLVHADLAAVLDRIDDPVAVAVSVARFELKLLAELGFGLDLDRCAATGEAGDLGYVSPKSGRAVSRKAGEPWHDRLLPLPAFLLDDVPARPTAGELAEGFAVTGFFLGRYVLEPRGLRSPEARERFIAATMRPLPRSAASA